METPLDKLDTDLTCSSCGLTFKEFEETGRLGCYDCYDSFAEYLEEIFKKIHYSTNHKGKQLDYILSERKITDEVKQLLMRLKEAVLEEEYEEATQIHRKLAQLDNSFDKNHKNQDNN